MWWNWWVSQGIQSVSLPHTKHVCLRVLKLMSVSVWWNWWVSEAIPSVSLPHTAWIDVDNWNWWGSPCLRVLKLMSVSVCWNWWVSAAIPRFRCLIQVPYQTCVSPLKRTVFDRCEAEKSNDLNPIVSHSQAKVPLWDLYRGREKKNLQPFFWKLERKSAMTCFFFYFFTVKKH